jgi:hypothetical protein
MINTRSSLLLGTHWDEPAKPVVPDLTQNERSSTLSDYLITWLDSIVKAQFSREDDYFANIAR